MEIGIRELKNRLSEIVNLASQGQQITITNHGQPLCILAPVVDAEIERPDFLQRAIDQGRIKPATRRGLATSTPIKPRKAGPSSTQLLVASRRANRF